MSISDAPKAQAELLVKSVSLHMYTYQLYIYMHIYIMNLKAS